MHALLTKIIITKRNKIGWLTKYVFAYYYFLCLVLPTNCVPVFVIFTLHCLFLASVRSFNAANYSSLFRNTVKWRGQHLSWHPTVIFGDIVRTHRRDFGLLQILRARLSQWVFIWHRVSNPGPYDPESNSLSIGLPRPIFYQTLVG